MNPERAKALQLLKVCRGQIDGVIKMIENDRYCIDISNQIIASQSLLKKANQQILKQHMQCCVKDAITADSADEKIDEMLDILNKLLEK
ncbi:MAG: metal-sensing transcriptional repressor [Clostridiaceae bacterium]